MTTSIITSPPTTSLTLSCRTCKLPSKSCACKVPPRTDTTKKRRHNQMAISMEDSSKKTRVLVERAQPPSGSPIDRYMAAHPRRQLLMTLYRHKLTFVPIFLLSKDCLTILGSSEEGLRAEVPWAELRKEAIEAARVVQKDYCLCLLDDLEGGGGFSLWYFHAPVDSIPPAMMSDYCRRRAEYAREVKNGLRMK